jgi:putative molybdopterin biosynthesis protein
MSRQRRYFLNDIPLEEARERFFGALRQDGGLSLMPEEIIPLAEAQGRITARPIWAAASSPHYDAAAMDGVAVRAAETTGATETAPVSLKVGPRRSGLILENPCPLDMMRWS